MKIDPIEKEKINTAAKWKEYTQYEDSLEVTIAIDENTQHKYTANQNALVVMDRKSKSPYLLNGKKILWKEDWDQFETTKIELEKVLLEADKLLQNKIEELFGGES